MPNLARVLVTCIRHPDVHNFTYNCISVRLLSIFVYIKPNKNSTAHCGLLNSLERCICPTSNVFLNIVVKQKHNKRPDELHYIILSITDMNFKCVKITHIGFM